MQGGKGYYIHALGAAPLGWWSRLGVMGSRYSGGGARLARNSSVRLMRALPGRVAFSGT